MELNYIIPIILLLSILQSILGIGLLVLGTPTLLILGFSFFETMAIILPPSIIISLLQILENKIDSKKFKSEFLCYCLPGVLIGIFFILRFEEVINFKLIAGIMLLLSGLIRIDKSLSKTNDVLKKNSKKFIFLME